MVVVVVVALKISSLSLTCGERRANEPSHHTLCCPGSFQKVIYCRGIEGRRDGREGILDFDI